MNPISAVLLALRSTVSALLLKASWQDATADFWGVYYSARFSKRGRA